MYIYPSWKQCENWASIIADSIVASTKPGNTVCLYGVPRGGIPAVLMVKEKLYTRRDIELTHNAKYAHFIIDDLIDSGTTQQKYSNLSAAPFFALTDKRPETSETHGKWVVFPWEKDLHNDDCSAEDIGARILQFIGEDVNREGLKETPARFVKALREWFSGYREDDLDLKSFVDGSEDYDQLILEINIPVWSHCEHHIAPFFGVAHIGYIPNGRIIGLSKLPRLVNHYAKRLQVQERLTKNICEGLETALSFDKAYDDAKEITIYKEPLGIGVVLQCRHTCMESRGIRQAGIVTSTTKLTGVLRTDVAARAEFLRMIPTP